MRALVIAAALAAGCGSAVAQSATPEDLDRLKRMLDERLPAPQPRTRGLSKGERPLRSDDFYSIPRREQDGNPSANPGKRSSTEAPTWLGVGTAAAGEGDAPRPPSAAAAPRGSQRVQARRDSYVIDLKTDLNGQQLDDALATLSQKYNLEVTRANKLGEILVSAGQPTATRSLAPAPAAPSLRGALEPKIIKQLRNEPFVDAAYVHFLVSPKTLPRRTDTKVQAGSDTYSWNWRLGETNDGNWGLKMLRMPPVWTILNRVRKLEPDRPRTRMAFLDVGFGTHSHISHKE